MVTCPLDNGNGTRVTYAKAFAYLTIDIKFARSGAVEAGVTSDNVFFGFEVIARAGRWQDADASTREALTEVVVGFALQTDVKAANSEGAERLTSRALELKLDGAVRQTSLSVFLGDNA